MRTTGGNYGASLLTILLFAVLNLIPARAATTATALTPTAVDLKVLVICADGSEACLPAITNSLKYFGTPYTVYNAQQTPGGLTINALENGTHALYNAVILTTAALGYYNTTSKTYQSALTTTEWTTLTSYEAICRVNQVTWYTYPNTTLGFTGTPTAVSTTTTPLNVSYTSYGAQVFYYTTTTGQLPITNAYTYLAPAANDGQTWPLLTDSRNNALALIHRYPDGHQNLAMTFDSNQYLQHNMVLCYGVINWAVNGLFLGKKRVFQSSQVDDLGLSSDTVTRDAGGGTVKAGADFRLAGSDLAAFLRWQQSVQAQPTTSNFVVSMAFNGHGFVSPDLTAGQTSDTLYPQVALDQGSFNWISHTYDHPDEMPASLDNTATSFPVKNDKDVIVNVLNSTFCNYEINLNTRWADGLRVTDPNGGTLSGRGIYLTGSNVTGAAGYNTANMITPGVTGLSNTHFLNSFYAFGGRNLVGDTSTPTKTRTDGAPNAGFMINVATGVRTNIIDPSAAAQQVLVQPRYPTNLYYNVEKQADWVAEYNSIYHAYWGTDLTYTQILDKESTFLVNYMLLGSNFPVMFHQANLGAYDGTNSLLSDLLHATFVKYNALMALPVKSLTMDQIGDEMRQRMLCDNSGMTGTLNYTATGLPASLVIHCTTAATVPVTGINVAGVQGEPYGTPTIAQYTSYIPCSDNGTVTININ